MIRTTSAAIRTLKPESSTFVNASIGGALDAHHLTWELVGFARNVSNLIDFGGFDAQTNQALFANVPGLVRVRGGELVLTAELGDVSATGSYTYTHSTESGGLQIDRVPEQQAKATIDYHPAALPFGLTASAEYVGRTFQSGLWDGREAYGRLSGGRSRWTVLPRSGSPQTSSASAWRICSTGNMRVRSARRSAIPTVATIPIGTSASRALWRCDIPINSDARRCRSAP
ncbi:MAG: TonB-dependent receptor, partial [Aliidongia sp.]